jgi:hypothetical protein
MLTINRKTLLLSAMASLGSIGAGCSGGSSQPFRSIHDFTVEGSESERVFRAPLITNRGEVILVLEEGPKETVVSVENYGRGDQRRIEGLTSIPLLYDFVRDQFVAVGKDEILLLNNDFSLSSRIPVSLPDGANLARIALDGDRFLIPPISIPFGLAKTSPAYQIDRTGKITNTFAIPTDFSNYPYMVRGTDQRLYVGWGLNGYGIGLIDEATGTVTGTGLYSDSSLVFDSAGYAYGGSSRGLAKLNLNTRSVVIETALPSEYTHFDAFGYYQVGMDKQNRLYVPVAPAGRRVLVFTT